MRLVSFPPEILASILSQISSSAIDLWLCGDRVLNYKLVHGGVSHLIIEDVLTCRHEKRIPPAILNFRLLSFRVSNPMSYFAGSNAKAALQCLISLPSSLRILHLDCKDAAALFFGGTRPLPSLYSDDADVSHRKESIQKYLKDQNITAFQIDWNEILPNLESLTVMGDFSKNYAPERIPRKVEHLHLQTNYFGSTNTAIASFENLPPNITSLRLPLGFITADNISTIPSKEIVSLHLDSFARPALEAAQTNWKQFFPKLVRVEGIFSIFANQVDPMIERHEGLPLQSYFPVEYFRIWRSTLPIAVRVPLPTSLTDLNLFDLDESSKDSVHDLLMSIGMLRTLKTLRIRLFDWDDISCGDWPPKLESLYAVAPLPLAAYSKLPRSLTLLNLREASDFPGNGIARPVREDVSLEKAAELGVKVLENEDKESWRDVTRTSEDAQNTTYSQSNLVAIQQGLHYGLPIGLKSFITDIAALEPSPLKFAVLPPKVINAKIRFSSIALLFGTIPNSLSDIHIEPVSDEAWDLPSSKSKSSEKDKSEKSEKKIDDKNQSAMDVQKSEGDVLNSTPEYLMSSPLYNAIYLNRLAITAHELKTEIFAHFPRTLSIFEFIRNRVIGRPEEVKAEALLDLPANLSELRLDGVQPVPNEHWTGKLPRKLVKISLSSAVVYGLDLDNLPPATEVLKVFVATNVAIYMLFRSDHLKFQLHTTKFVDNYSATQGGNYIPGFAPLIFTDSNLQALLSLYRCRSAATRNKKSRDELTEYFKTFSFKSSSDTTVQTRTRWL